MGEPETLIVDSTLLEVLHPRQVAQSAGFEGAGWVRWGSFAVYDSGEGEGLHLRLLHQQVARSYPRAHQGAVGMKTSQHSSSIGRSIKFRSDASNPRSSPQTRIPHSPK